jgi:hypothetical protein
MPERDGGDLQIMRANRAAAALKLAPNFGALPRRSIIERQ